MAPAPEFPMTVRPLMWLVVLLLAAAAPPQIIGVELVDDATRVKYAQWLIEHQGKQMVIGEVISGLEVDAKGTITKPGTTKKVVMVVADPARPDLPVVEPDGKGGRHVLLDP